MPVLKNKRRELFCQEIAARVDPPQAYKNAGFTANTERTAIVSAAKLLKSAAIQKRIAELSQQIAAKIQAETFVVGEVHDRKYRLSVLGEVAERLLCEIRRIKNLRRQKTLLSELREYLKQASIEIGDWVEKRDNTIKIPPPDPALAAVPTEVLEAALAKMKEAEAMLCIEAAPGSVEEVSLTPL